MFKVGDKVVCVENTFATESDLSNSLTLGKTYTVTIIYGDKDFINVISDKKVEQRYWAKRFVSLTRIRKYKIDKICSNLEIK
jgi:hypothetical protein